MTELNKILRESGEQESDPMDLAMVPLFEARYLLTDKLLEENRIDQVLEVAAGLSLRGPLMAMRSASQHFSYVEIDQPAVVALKKKIFPRVKPLLEKISSKGKLDGWSVGVGNALNPRSLAMASRHFWNSTPFAVVNEGLMVYFTHREKTLFARNVHHLLERFGGIWITSDIMTTDAFSNVPNWEEIKKTGIAGLAKIWTDVIFRICKEQKNSTRS
jgi:O-methyltransferase involved in polyketide biosynthesis